jgi:hypothetical protein
MHDTFIWTTNPCFPYKPHVTVISLHHNPPVTCCVTIRRAIWVHFQVTLYSLNCTSYKLHGTDGGGWVCENSLRSWSSPQLWSWSAAITAQSNLMKMNLYHNTSKKCFINIGLIKHGFRVSGIKNNKANAHTVHLQLQCRILHVWAVTTWLAWKYRVSKQSSQIHSVFLASPRRHCLL